MKSACKWCFDAAIEENETLSFLQICIGLEALFGDTTYNGALAETLADRCSYLVGNNIKGRKNIKDGFKKLYEARSKLVHGNALELTNSQSGLLGWGKHILNTSILKEIKHLNL